MIIIQHDQTSPTDSVAEGPLRFCSGPHRYIFTGSRNIPSHNTEGQEQKISRAMFIWTNMMAGMPYLKLRWRVLW